MRGYDPALQVLCCSVRLVRLATEHQITQSATEHYNSYDYIAPTVARPYVGLS